MARTVKAVPKGYHTVTPALVLRDCADAIDFYRKALGAEIKGRMTGPDGKIMHAEIVLGDSVIMLADEDPSRGVFAPTADHPVPTTLCIYTDDARRLWKRAVNAGVKVTMELDDQFWGDRYGTFEDPYGYKWAIGQRVKDLSDKEILQAQNEFVARAKP